jgi:phosphoribosylformimino-5-aminoimidazole carboxamide ribotide isomerase
MESSNPPSGFPAGRPRIIPVIDLMGGRVVRAVGGRRREYRPVRSVLTVSTEPGEVARALVAATGAEWLYVADLDAIMHGGPPAGWSILRTAAAGAAVLCDAGIRMLAQTGPVSRIGVRCVVATETGSLAIVSAIASWECAVSIDLRDGTLVGDPARWGGTSDPLTVAALAVQAGAVQLIVLDLARVGTGIGSGTEQLVAAIKKACPRVEVLAGGGVRTWADVQRLTDAGADAVLVASALHDGTLTLPRPTA